MDNEGSKNIKPERKQFLNRWGKLVPTFIKNYKKWVLGVFFLFLFLVSSLFLLAMNPVPDKIVYGMSFNTLYARELGLPWEKVYDAFLDELKVRHLRLAAHWPMVEPRPGVYNFSELDYQLERATQVGAKVILGVGRRLPRWPECHVPNWAKDKGWESQKESILRKMEVVMNRYKDQEAIVAWQVENEPYLEVFAKEHCGDFDEEFFLKQVDFAREIDPSRPILITDSGNLGLWSRPYKHSDMFGTSVYVYFWNPELGQFRTIIPAWFYRVKDNLVKLRHGRKETILIELSAEPWLLEPISEVPIEIQFTRMNLKKFDDILKYAERTRYGRQYLWGGEWWYWLREKGHPEFWEKGKQLFSEKVSE